MNRRSTDEAEDGDHHGITGGSRCRHGKEVFHLVGLGTDGTIAFRQKIKRLSLKDVFEQLHRASLDCLGDRLSIVVIVLLPLHEGFGVDRRDGAWKPA
jgi:hypothetical protein